MYTAFAFTNDELEKDKMYNFWMWMLVPIAATAMSISFALKPRRRDMLYKVFLCLQFLKFSVMSEVLAMVGRGFETAALI